MARGEPTREVGAKAGRRAGRGRACGRPVFSRDEHLCDLMEAVGEGDQGAFTELFRHLAPRLRRLFVCRGASMAVADELTQETMLLVWRHAATFDRRRASVATWVFTIARNKQLDLVRTIKRLHEVAEEPPEADLSAAAPDGEQILRCKQSGEILEHAIGALPRDQALVVRQAFCEAKSHSEIAAEQALPLGTVKSRIRLALAHLRTSVPVAALR
jgi:RNA polymerase sigma-70 factor, ECF subfamily